MQQSARLPTNPPENPDSVAEPASEQSAQRTVEADDLLELLGDEYTYRVFEAVVEKPRTGRELIETTDVSKPTVYRRLQELEAAGLVESTVKIASDGNHCKQFHTTVTSVAVSFDADGFTARLESESRPASARATTDTRPVADD
ncbi:MAG: sugar-specific transcriptional regulator TrmB [halophilic archaeon J07HX64]|jgi:Sugar-specific transcriptional regulator TrmB.|nr:MAG: sugar-specific transcriptional regulator TrmB [halophilic archaeon J07HX64]